MPLGADCGGFMHGTEVAASIITGLFHGFILSILPCAVQVILRDWGIALVVFVAVRRSMITPPSWQGLPDFFFLFSPRRSRTAHILVYLYV